MKKIAVITILILSAFINLNWHEPYKNNSPKEIARNWIRQELTNSQQQVSLSILHLNESSQLKTFYTKARKHYKHIEFFMEYCSPREAKNYINGPLVPKCDPEIGNESIPPQGFQRIEELLYNVSKPIDTIALKKEYNLLISQLSEINKYYESIEIRDEVLLEMCQLELFRIAAMNLSGYDATISQTNVIESYWCLEGIETVSLTFKFYSDKNNLLKQSYKTLLGELTKAKKHLLNHTDYNTFNRLEFITDYTNPLNKAFVLFHNSTELPWTERKQAINLKHGFLFGRESLNIQYFSMYYHDTVNIQLQAQLGKLLFFDPVLSGNNKRSCASCHNPSKGFTDGLSKSIGFDQGKPLERNTPTLLNAIYQKAFFHDGRAYQLEQQIFDVVHNKNEMQSSFEDVVLKLRKSAEYKQLFSNAFKSTPDSCITSYSIQKAITEYEKTLVSFNSRFDQYLHGEKNKLNKNEINGYNLFAGKSLCGSCHFLPLFNGTVPPFYNDSEFEVIGTPADSNNKQLDSDKGRYLITNFDEQMYAFKTPTIRNIELTSPYMHNGIYTSLEQVVEFYHKGGGAGLKFPLLNQTLPFDSLQLSKNEKTNIVLFLKTLTDTIGLTAKPSRLPLFENDLLLNNRISEDNY